MNGFRMFDWSLVCGRGTSCGAGARTTGSGTGEAEVKLPSLIDVAIEDLGAFSVEDPELGLAGESAWDSAPTNRRAGEA